ncbi:uncharacterized protein PSFLO_00847 [Pseudozyma flocculosa]|uniref:Uncharacterized protein n=1 Tax=Pseudozyma flocculosa TaxID=84751 RepID=A0A5C3EUZ9_9BASI|nr:uncharacterized protein PSFLO_00847 [Pseudozyma flocculosa]
MVCKRAFEAQARQQTKSQRRGRCTEAGGPPGRAGQDQAGPGGNAAERAARGPRLVVFDHHARLLLNTSSACHGPPSFCATPRAGVDTSSASPAEPQSTSIVCPSAIAARPPSATGSRTTVDWSALTLALRYESGSIDDARAPGLQARWTALDHNVTLPIVLQRHDLVGPLYCTSPPRVDLGCDSYLPLAALPISAIDLVIAPGLPRWTGAHSP